MDCVLCTRRINEWERACGKTVIINGQEVHTTCVATVKAAQVQTGAQVTHAKTS